jgi:hypothetical protein
MLDRPDMLDRSRGAERTRQRRLNDRLNQSSKPAAYPVSTDTTRFD